MSFIAALFVSLYGYGFGIYDNNSSVVVG
jgi:hypothetical protein